MHDFLLAKQIVDKILEIAKGRNLSDIKSATLEIGSIALGHNDIPEHTEDVSIENLKFGIENLVQNTILENSKFDIKKVEGNSWKIVEIRVK